MIWFKPVWIIKLEQMITSLIKIKPLTCSLLLICRAWDIQEQVRGLILSDWMSMGSWKKTSALIGAIYSLGVSIVPSVETFKQRSQQILSGHLYKLILTFDHVTWKLKGVTHFLGASVVPCLATSKNQRQKILSGQYFNKDQKYDLGLWPRKHPLYKFCNFKATRSKDVDRASLCLQTDRQVQNNICPFFKGGGA